MHNILVLSVLGGGGNFAKPKIVKKQRVLFLRQILYNFYL